MAEELREESFVNDLGQIFNPGEEVLFLGSSWGQTRLKRGIFKGVYWSNYGRNDPKYHISAVKLINTPKRTFNYDDDNNYKSIEKLNGTSKLQSRRIFKIDTPLSALEHWEI